MTRKRLTLGLVLVSISVIGLLMFTIYLPTRTNSLDYALNIAEQYGTSLDNSDIAIDEIMEFEQNFYVVYYEISTGIGAFEMLIDKDTGRIFPEYGPNMMWNTKYGHAGMMGGWRQAPSVDMPVNEAEAASIAQEYLNRFLPGTVAEESHPFYGYYTIHVTKEGGIYGMLSVNGYDGTVWYHNWHGAYIQGLELHED